MTTTGATAEPLPKRRRINDSSSNSDQEKPAAATATTSTTSTADTTTTTTSTTTSSSNKIYVGNIHARVQQVHLEKLLQPYGTVVHVHVCYHKDSGHPRGYAFCQFANARQATAAIAALHGRKLLGKLLVVQSAKQEGTTTSTSASAKGSTTSKQTDHQKLTAKIEKLKQALKNESK